MDIIRTEPDAIASLALTPRRQSPEMAQLEWSDDQRALLRPFYMIVSIVAGMALISVLIHFG